jgi:thiol-disulfide isomerase/thioredoxin
MNRHRTPRVVVLAVLSFGLALGAAPASAKDAKQETSKKVVVAGTALKASDAIGTPKDPAIGTPAPTLTGKGFDGKTVTIGGPGAPRAVLFVAHWCPHCQAEVPRIVKLAKQDKLAGVEFDTVTTGTSSEYPNYPPSKWLKREKWPFKNVLNDDAKQRAMRAYGGTSYPYFVLLDAAGNVAARASGELAPQAITDAVTRLAAGQSVFATG